MSMQELQRYVGHYMLMGYPLEVKVINGQLASALPGVPAGYEVTLTPTATPHTFQMNGGPMSGAPTIFQFDDAGDVEKIVVGEFELPRCAPPTSDSPTLLLPPTMLLDNQ